MALITDGFVAHAQAHPQQVALDLGQRRYRYGELLTAVEQVAAGVARGVGSVEQQPRIGLLLPDPVTLLNAFLGTAMAGGIAMVLNPDWPLSQIQHVLKTWPPALLLAHGYVFQGLEQQLAGVEAIATLASLPNAAQDMGTWMQSQPPWTARCIPDETPFYIGFTSGTTGLPKGVIRHHRSWVNSMAVSRAEFGVADDEHILVPGSLAHSLSLYTAIEALAQGCTLHSFTRFSPKTALQRLQTAPITRLVAVPTLLSAIARAATRAELTFPQVRSLISGGSKLNSTLRDQLLTVFPQAHLMEYYGASELSFISLASTQEAVPPASVGRAFKGVNLSIRRDQGGPAAVGEIGLIGVQSELICSGYLESSESCTGGSQSGFRIEQGWATVGDRGWLDDRGYLYLVGRERDMLICNGINVYPSEIEAVLLNHPAIEEAAVVGLPDDCRGDLICAVMQGRSPETQSPHRGDLVAIVKASLEPSKCPRRWFWVEALPLTSSGKVNRSALKAQILNGFLNDDELHD